MNMNRTYKLLKPIVLITIIIFLIISHIKKPSNIEDFFGIFGYTATCTCIVFFLYNKFLWKFKFLNICRIPVFKDKYKGILSYNFEGVAEKKDFEIFIKQNFININVSMKTDEIRSDSIIGDFIEENGVMYLIYTYRTDPKSAYSENNPIQYGTCKLDLSDMKNIHGKYWTFRKTIGDLEWMELNNN